jgi:hypothetical protein
MTTTSAHLIDVSPNAPASVSLAAVDKVYGSGQNTVVALDKLSL